MAHSRRATAHRPPGQSSAAS